LPKKKKQIKEIMDIINSYDYDWTELLEYLDTIEESQESCSEYPAHDASVRL
jgi:hypothetical protein